MSEEMTFRTPSNEAGPLLSLDDDESKGQRLLEDDSPTNCEEIVNRNFACTTIRASSMSYRYCAKSSRILKKREVSKNVSSDATMTSNSIIRCLSRLN